MRGFLRDNFGTDGACPVKSRRRGKPRLYRLFDLPATGNRQLAIYAAFLRAKGMTSAMSPCSCGCAGVDTTFMVRQS